MWLFIAILIHIVDYVKLIFSANGAALIVRAAPLRSAETVFCFSFQPNAEAQARGFSTSPGAVCWLISSFSSSGLKG